MSASSMTAFVRNLFKQSDDYRALTQRIIRERYMQHANVDSLDDDQRSLLREIVQIMVGEMVQGEELKISNEEAKDGNVTAVKTQQSMTTKTVSQKENSDMSATEPEVSNSETERGKSSKSKVLSRQVAKNPTKSKAVEQKKKLPELSGGKSSRNEDLKAKKLKRTTAKKRKSSELSDSQPCSDEETNPESELSKPQKETEKKRAKPETEVVSRKRKRSSSSEIEPASNKVIKSESWKRNLDSEESSDGESLQQFKDKWSATNKTSEDDDGASTKEDLGTSRKATDKSKNSVKTINKSEAFDDSGSEDEETLADIKKKSLKSSNDSDDEPSSTTETVKKSIKAQEKRRSKKSTPGKRPSKTPTQSDDKNRNVKKLEKIARACGILPVGRHYRLMFEHCRDNKARKAKLTQMLRDAGMTGEICMEAAEMVKLKKEAAELLSTNVIMPEGRGRRSASSLYSTKRRDREPSSSPTPPTPPARETFSGLKGIVDSEEDSD